MRKRTHLFAVASVLGIGAVALVLLPGGAGPVTKADADQPSVALTSIASPNPDLLRRLDAEVSPPPVAAPAPKADTVTQVATAQPASLTTGTDVAATPVPAVTPNATNATIGGSAVNLRSGPSTSSGAVSVLKPGEAVQTGESVNGWVKVTRADGTSGWVYSSYLSTTAAAQASAKLPAATAPAPTKVAKARTKPVAPQRAVIKGADDSDLEDRVARIGSRLPAYTRPGDSAQVAFSFEPGERVRISEVRGNWLRVETSDGTSAWIRR